MIGAPTFRPNFTHTVSPFKHVSALLMFSVS
jgi:hypothetical protein